MTKLILRRSILSNRAVLGKLILDDKEICKTLENPWLNNAKFISCIPFGEYKCESYSSPKYPNVWEVKDVRNRTNILFHIGNFEKDTSGCILVGKDWAFMKDELSVVGSRITLNKLRRILPDEFALVIELEKI